ncbi:MAG: cytochrome c [Anaeromyxobacteraceae bacterium]
MNRTSALLGLALLPLLAGCPSLDPMWRQPKAKAYQEDPQHADGLSMRAPPAGTVQFRSISAAPVMTGRGEDGQYVKAAPVALDAAALARGRKKFDIHCAVCHGVLGDGESQLALNMSLRKPPNLHQPVYRDAADGYLYDVVTHGFGLMPGYARELGEQDRWAVVGYVRALQLSQAAGVADAPAAERAKLEGEAR